MTSRCTATGQCDAHRDGAAPADAKCPYFCDYGACRRKAVHESRGGRSYCAEHAGRPGRLPGSTRGGSRIVQFRVSDAEYAALQAAGNPNAVAKSRTLATPATPTEEET